MYYLWCGQRWGRWAGWIHISSSVIMWSFSHIKKIPHASSFLSKENSTNDFASRKVLMVKKKLREKKLHIVFPGRHTTKGTVPAAHQGVIRLQWAWLYWGSQVIKSKKLNDVKSHNRWWVILLAAWARRQVILGQIVTPSPKKNLV